MTVKAILTGKRTGVTTVAPTATLADAARRLAQHRIGALVVQGADDGVVGIITERDIIRAIGARGGAALEEPVAQVMTSKVITCRSSETVSSIMETMTNNKFRHVPVVEQGELVGIVSIGDVVKYRLDEIEGEFAALRDYILTA